MHAVKQQGPLKQMAGGAAIVGTPLVRVLGDVAIEDAVFMQSVQELFKLRRPLAEARAAYKERRHEVKEVGSSDAASALALEASKAILLVRSEREAVKEAAEAAQKAKERQQKRRK